MTLYAAADRPLPEIPEALPPRPLSARPISVAEEAVRVHFSKQHVFVLGSHTLCGCGFQYGNDVDLDLEGRESVRQLGEYLRDAVERVGSLELYACWKGDEARAVESRVALSPAAFDGEREQFDLEERWFAVVDAVTE